MILRRLYPYWRSSRRLTAGGTSLLLLGSAIELLEPWPIKWLIDGVFGDQPAPEWLVRLWPAFGRDDPVTGALGVALAMVTLAVLRHLVAAGSQLALIRAGWRVVLELRCRLLDHLYRLSLTYHDATRVGESLYRVAYDTQAAQTLLTGAVVPAAAGAVVAAGIVVVMLALDPLLTVVALIAAPAFWVVISGFGNRIERGAKQYHERESSVVSMAQETLSSIRALQAFTMEPMAHGRFRRQAEESVRANERLSATQLAFAATVSVVLAAGTAAVVYVGALRVAEGRLYLGDILVFLAYLGMLYKPVSVLSQSVGVVRSTGAQLRRVFDVLDTEPEVRERPGARRLSRVEGLLELENVSFGYRPDQPVLTDVDLRVERGQTVALVGRTGAGKTTLAGLLIRFHDPVVGTVRLDGHDLRDLELPWLRQQVSIVLQDPVLFSGTIRENIAYGRPDATDAEIEEAARRAQADEFISALPAGYATELGEAGVNLSGGQRQRIAIARAFLKDAPLLVLDEPTSALDAATESALVEVLRRLMAGRTTIVIAHRLSTVRYADQVVVLERGRIVERGTHDELRVRGGTYQELWLAAAGGRLDQALTT